jgi:citryl-CoA synthetase large subunit
MNLYEFEGKQLFDRHGIAIPRGIVVHREDDVTTRLKEFGIFNTVVKAQVLSGKRGKNNGIRFCSSEGEILAAVQDLFAMDVRGQYVAAVRIEEKLDIAEEHYLSITYDTNRKQPVIIYSTQGGVDIEDVEDSNIIKQYIDIREPVILSEAKKPLNNERDPSIASLTQNDKDVRRIIQQLWTCFLEEDARTVEINPLVKTMSGEWIAADAKVALDDDAAYRHNSEAIVRAQEKGIREPMNWEQFGARTMLGRPPTEREVAVGSIDTGEDYYKGTAGKYIEMNGDIAILFSGGGASIANMDALIAVGLLPANYTEYSGNPPREKVYQLAKIVLSKPGLRGLWICGGVANFTNVEATFHGIVDALDEVKPTYPIVVRRAGPFEKQGMELMRACAERNNLNMTLFGKEVSMSETALILSTLIE